MLSRFSLFTLCLVAGFVQTASADDYPSLTIYEKVAKETLADTQNAKGQSDIASLQAKTRALINVGLELMKLYQEKNPACAPQYAAFFKEITAAMETKNVDELHERYHDAKGLPAAPKQCYLGRSQVIHPVLNFVRLKSPWTEQLRSDLILDLEEIIEHVPRVKRHLDSPIQPELKTEQIAVYQNPTNREVEVGETLPARRSSGTVVADDVLYVVGGHVAKTAHGFYEKTFLTTFQAFDLKTKTWKQLPDRPHAGRFSTLVVHANKLYSFGGFFSKTPADETHVSYDIVDRFDLNPAIQSWSTLSVLMPHKRSQHSVVHFQNKVYLIGGWDSKMLAVDSPTAHQDAFVRPIDIFNLDTETFESSSFSMPETGRRGFSTVTWQNKIVVSGGFGDKPGAFLDSVIAFDPAASSQETAWTTLPSLPKKMIFPMIVTAKGNLYLIGGTVPREGGRLNTAYVLTPDAKAWAPITFVPGQFVERTLVQAGNDSWLLVGGRNQSDQLTPAIDLIQP